MLVLTMPTRVIEPGGDIKTPFGDKLGPSSETDPTIITTIDDANLAALRAALSSTPNAHLSAAELAAQYSPSELTAALTAALTK